MRSSLRWEILLRTLLAVFVTPITRCHRIISPEEIIKILDSRYYDKYLTPTHKEEKPTLITIGFYVEGMSTVRAQTMDFHLDIYFEQTWVEPRLRHNGYDRVLVKDDGILARMWHPDLYFANANNAKFFDITAPNFLLWIFPNGTVHHDMRISLTVLCNMDFTKYPLDSQQCGLRILSYAYTEDQLNISWRERDPIVMNDQLQLPDMQLEDVESGYCPGEYLYGNWSCVRAEFNLRREKMHHFLQNYVPTILIVIISWFSFWLDAESVPGRVSLCITTLLTLATQASSARMALPQVSYAKAIDVWLEACLGFVFGVLIEFTIVNVLSRSGKLKIGNGRDLTAGELLMLEGKRAATLLSYRRYKELDDPRIIDDSAPLALSEEMASLEHEFSYPWRRYDGCGYPYGVIGYRAYRKSSKYAARRIDRSCRIAFPLAFTIFNAVYWTYYLKLA